MPDFTKNPPSHPLLSRPINVYSIPPELLDLLTVRSVTNTGALQVISSAEAQDPTAVDEEQSGENYINTKKTGEEEAVIVETGSTSSLTCQTCLSATFPTLEEQRAHFKSDWHRYNVRVSINHKGSLKGSLQGKGGRGVPRGVLTEEEFEEVDDGVSSLSGSASDTSASSHSPSTPASASGISTTDRITKLVQRAHLQPLSRSQTPTGQIEGEGDGTAAGEAGLELDSDEEAEQNEYRRRAELRTAVVWYGVRKKDSHPDPATQAQAQQQGQKQQQTLVPVDTQLGVHRALLPPGLSDPSTFLPALRSIQLPYKSSSTGHDFDFDHENPNAERKLTLLMVAGGHFAGMVVALKPLNLIQGKGVKAERQDVKGAGEIRVLRHKTFHRYTTRKKQGGSQALNDNAKSKANSAGAMLRRYGEQSLQEEIQRLMIEWADEVRTSEKIFLRASTAGKRSFWGYEGAVLEKGDERVVTFPFPTRRPTLAELFRCYHELTRVKITHLSDEAILALEQAYIASLQPKTRPVPTQSHTPQIKEKETKPKLSQEEDSYRERRNRLVDMVRKGRMEPLQAFWAKHDETFGGVDAIVKEWADEGSGMTLLMIASQAGQEDVTRWLLEDLRADPTLTLGGGGGEEVKEADEQDPTADAPAPTTATPTAKGRGRTAYDLTTSKPVRNVFRRLAHDHPEWHDWIGAAHVPSGLSEEKELEQEKKKADRRKGMREKAKEREAKRPVEVAAPEPVAAAPAPAKPLTGPQKLGGGRPGGDTSSLAGLTPEMRQRIERERRARAAEARLTGK